MPHLTAPLVTVRQHRAKVAHRATGNKEGCFLAHHGRGHVLKSEDSRVISPDVIAHLCLRVWARRMIDGSRHPRTGRQDSVSWFSSNVLLSAPSPFPVFEIGESISYLGHGLAHRRRWPCDCVAAQVNHLCAQQLPRASKKEALFFPMPLNAAMSCTDLSVYWTHVIKTQSNAADGPQLTAW